MDGVLVDTGEPHFYAWDETFRRLNQPFNREQFRRTFGMNNTGILNTILKRPLDEDFIARWSDIKEQLFRDAIRGSVQPMPGVLDWIDRLREMGFRQAVASSAPQANIDALVDEMALRDRFDALVSGADLPGKPDPAVFLKAARLIGVQPERCVVLEDSVAGVRAAKRAGMACIAVLTTNPPADLDGADLIVARLDQLAPERVLTLIA
jgi:HAD superfamily hydrolase (TIGR01509 family)